MVEALLSASKPSPIFLVIDVLGVRNFAALISLVVRGESFIVRTSRRKAALWVWAARTIAKHIPPEPKVVTLGLEEEATLMFAFPGRSHLPYFEHGDWGNIPPLREEYDITYELLEAKNPEERLEQLMREVLKNPRVSRFPTLSTHASRRKVEKWRGNPVKWVIKDE